MSELLAAVAELQANPPKITKRGKGQVGSREYKYATLDAVWDALRPWRLEHGIIWVCCPTILDGSPVLAYRLESTRDGSSVSGHYPLTDAHGQALGADITYARRYALCAVLGLLADEDTDGRAIEPRQRQRARIDTEHERLANSVERVQPEDRPAARARKPATDDVWTDQPAGDFAPFTLSTVRGSIDGKQLKRIMGRLGRMTHDSRAARLRNLTGDESIESTNDLSAAQAEDVLRQLEGA